MSPRIRSASIAFRLSFWIPALAVAAALVFLAWLMAGTAAAQQGIAETQPTNLMLFADGVPAEGGEPVTIIAGLRNPAGPEGVSVTLTAGGTATSDDYSLSANIINIVPGTTAGLATVTATDDALDDDGETIILSATDSSSSPAAASLTLTIMDNDDGAFVITPRCNPLTTSDYDRNNNGLIDVCNLAQLNAIRYDTYANGFNVSSSGYRAAYPNARGGMGCPWGTCKGYELTANLDFDTNANGRADAGDAFWNGGQGWTPFAFRGVFDGQGATISNLFVATPNSGAGLFSTLGRDGIIRDVRLDSVDVSTQQSNAGGLVGENRGTIFGVSVSGAVSGASAVGGLVGAARDTSRIIASVATASVTGSQDNAGGLVGHNNGRISTSYAIGRVSGSAANIGGLVGRGESNLVSDSYFDTVTSGQTSSAGGVGKTSSKLQQPTGYAGIYADWNVDVDGDELLDDPWCFGTASDYPTPKLRGMPCPNLPAPVPADKVDYDTDDDGLIEVSNLAQLSAIRLNTTGDGRSFDNGSKYREAYPNAADFMGCAVRGNSYFGRLCKGYELTTDLDFDTNGNGRLDSGDWNGGRWEPIKGGFRAVFDGNGYTIRNMVAQGSRGVGLFQSLNERGVIRNVRLESVDVRGSVEVGGLVGSSRGAISGSGVSGSVYGSTSVGGLVGSAGPSSIIAGSHSTASVYLGSDGDKGGGLVGSNEGAVRGSYAVGAVSGNSYVNGLVSYPGANNVGGLVGYSHPTSVIIASYAVGEVSSSGQNIGGLVGHHAGTVIASYWNTVLSRAGGTGGVSKTTTELQSPTDYTGIYASWNVDLDGDNSVDDPWDFGTSSEYPVLKYGGISVAEQRALMPVIPAVAVADGLEDVTIVHESGTQEISLPGVFSDADGDSVAGLTITTASSNEAVATASVASDYSTLTVAAQDWGKATITVTADDGNGGTAADSFTVTVKNAPEVNWALADVSGLVEGTTQEVSLSSPYSVFFDGDGEDLTITAASSDETIATVAVAADGSKLTLTGVAEGTVTIAVTAQDSDGNQVSDTFDVSVVKKYAGLIAQMYQWRNGPEAQQYGKPHTDRWDRALLAFGETVADTTLTPMTAAEAQALADQDWGTRWVPVAKALKEIESSGQQNQQQQQSPLNRAPTVASALADATIVNESGTRHVSLSGVFDDADNDALTVTAASSDETKATVSVAASYSSLTVTAKARGTANITVTARDGNGGTVQDTFTVTVKAAPTVALAPSGVSGLEAGATRDVSLSGVFSDADGDALTVTAGSGDTGVATVTVAADYSSLTVTGVAEGSATITVTAQDADGNRVSHEFDVAVTPPPQQQGQDPANQVPTVSSAISDATITSESGTHQASLSGVFSDADNDSLTVTAASSDTARATVSVAAGQSSLTVTAKARGTATITVTAKDGNGGSVSDSFTVRVKAAPVVTSALAGVSELEAGSTRDVSLAGVFSDADGDSLTVTAASSASAIATATVAADYSTLTLTGVAEGTATVTVTAQDSDGNTVSDRFDVTVPAPPPPNRAPTVANAIADVTITNESGTHRVSLAGVFADADNDSLTITAGSSNDAAATVSVAAGYSSLTVNAQARGAATITVTADDGNGGTVSDAFTVRVKAAPVVASAIADVSGLEEGDTREVSLSGVFSDADGDPLTITAASSANAITTVTVAADQSRLTLTGVAEGTATITVTAQDSDGNRVSDRFAVTVEPEPGVDPPPEEETSNRAPVVANPIDDFSLEGPEYKQFDLDEVFHDPDGDELKFSAVSSKYNVATMWVDGSTLMVVGTGMGTATITVTAKDPDGNTVSDEFDVTARPAS